MYQVRDGKQVAPTCPECGCRLIPWNWNEDDFDKSPPNSWNHYYGTEEKDARGCLCSLYTQEFIIDPNNGLDKGSIIVV